MIERRTNQRLRSYIGGQVAFNGRSSVIDCLIRNKSANGVKLVFSSPAHIPDEFDLVAPKIGESQRVRVVWRRELEAGVEYTFAGMAAVVSIESARIIRKLRDEQEAFKNRISQLSEPG